MEKVEVAGPAFGKAEEGKPRARMPRRLVAVALACAGLSLAVSLAGKPAGHLISLAGYSDDQMLRHVAIGEDRLAVPSNLIRHAQARRNGPATRLDLYLRWPQMDGFSEAARDDFNNKGGERRLLFISLEPRSMSRDMSGRLEPIYRGLLAGAGRSVPGGALAYDFTADSGYLGETLVVREREGAEALVARCLADEASASLAPCERDISVGKGLSLTYRFPRELLADWPAVEAAIRLKAAALLSAAG